MTIRYKRPDHKNAKSLVLAAKDEMDFTLSMPINEKSASTIIRNVYESFRMIGDALLISKGISSQDHVECINELLKLKIEAKRPTGILNNLRILRHSINYYGYKPKLDELKDTLALAKTLFPPIYSSVLKKIEN